MHGVWKSQKKSHSPLRAKRAMFTFWVDKRSLKMVQCGDFLETSNFGQLVLPDRSKTSGKCQNWRNETFWAIFKQCDYGFDMAVKQTVSTHVSSLSVDVININRSTESRCAANFYMGTLFVFSDSWSYLLEENTWLTINQGIDTYSPIPQSNTLNVGRGREFMYPIHVKKYST